MKSSITILSSLAALLLLPAVAGAQALPAAVWASGYQPLPIAGGSAVSIVPLSPNGDVGQSRSYLLPNDFDFRFQGTAYSEINIGAKGYITFGTHATDHSAASASPSSLLGGATPRNLVAAWWGNHFCNQEAGELKTQVLGTRPNRQFVIEWHCRRNGTFDGPGATRFQAQLWLYETSHVIRASYGQVKVDPANDWGAVSWGYKGSSGAGTLGPDRKGGSNACDPAGTSGTLPKCMAGAHFPTSSTIQYGLFPHGDLTGAVEAGALSPGPNSMELEVSTTLRNVGDTSLAGITYDLYLSRTQQLVVGGAQSVRIHRQQSPVSLPAAGSLTFQVSASTQRPANGIWYLCAMLDPENVLGEIDRVNNAFCSFDPLSLGPDLTGSIEVPREESEAGAPILVPITIRNVGTYRATPFSFAVVVEPDDVDGMQFPSEEIYFGKIEEELEAGAEVSLDIATHMPAVARGDRYTFVLELDVLREVDEVLLDNNIVRSSNQLVNRKPLLIMKQPLTPVFPDGCFYGEAIEATMTACNLGEAKARNFYPGLVMGPGSQMSILFDVAAATFPQSCHDEGSPNFVGCEPYRGKEQICVQGRCAAQCVSNADCSRPLVCQDDPALAALLGMSGARSCATNINFPDGFIPTGPCRICGGAGGAGGGDGEGGEGGEVCEERCEAGRCDEEDICWMPRVEECEDYIVRGKIPVVNQRGAYYEPGKQRFHFTADVSFSLSETLPSQFSTEEYECREALPDLVPVGLSTSGPMIAGEVATIVRTIANVGFIPLPRNGEPRPTSIEVEYGYYLSRVPEISINQIPLELVSPQVQHLGRKDQSVGVDRVRLPTNLAPGDYYLGLIADPHGRHRELSKSNNVLVKAGMVRVEPSVLQILDRGLPAAILGDGYTHQFTAAGAAEAYRWTAEGLPPDFTMSEDGLLRGRAYDAGLSSFLVRLQAGTRTIERMFALLAVTPLGSLEISTTALPAAMVGEIYGGDPADGGGPRGIRLGAHGGMGPYRWGLDPNTPNNRLPDGLEGPTEDGVIRGTPSADSVTTEFTVRVRDAAGNSATRRLRIPVVRSSELSIISQLFSEGTTSWSYDACVEAIGGASLQGYQWDVDPATVPSGLEAEVRGEKACLRGTPTSCGSFLIRVLVQDVDGQSDMASIPLTVECERILLLTKSFPALRRGEEVDLELMSDAGESPRFRLIHGVLPAGLSLDADGRIHGTVEADAAFGTYPVGLRIQDEAGRQGLGALALEVSIEPREPVRVERKTGGCSSAASAGSLGLGLALLGLLHLGRRRG